MTNKIDQIAIELAGTLVQDLQRQIVSQVSAEVANELLVIDIPTVVQTLSNQLAETFVNSLTQQIADEVAKKSSTLDVEQTVRDTAAQQTEALVETLTTQISKQVAADIDRKLAQIDIQQAVREYVNLALAGVIKDINFPDGSIPGAAIDLSKFLISGDNITAGIIQHFGSTGIQDGATQCQLTVADNFTAVENKLIAAEAEIKGTLRVEGDFILAGEIPTDSPFYKDLVEHSAGLVKLSLDGSFFDQYAGKVFDRIKEEGIDLNKLTLDGNEILKGNQLGYSVTESNLQKVGELRSLRVNGQTSLSNTVYVVNGRLGINTEEPAAALTIWDQEIELLGRKLRKNVAFFGTDRNHQLVLSSSNKENIVLETDGSATIKNLTVGQVSITSASAIPKHDAKPGTLVLNEMPDVGSFVGWVSIGGARWSGFGEIK